VIVDRDRIERRIAAAIEHLRGSRYTRSLRAIQRHAYIPEYMATLAYFTAELESLGFDVDFDPVGTLVARNRPVGTPVVGLGSHCDSNRNGGAFDGTLGVVVAVEVCRSLSELEIDVPLQVMSFLEEEASGFGELLLGSRVMLNDIPRERIQELRSIDDGRPFLEHASEAGFCPDALDRSGEALDDLIAWIEVHIEQGRVLQDAGVALGVVSGIYGYIHGDITITGRGDHAGATPMNARFDPVPAMAEIVLELERLAREAGADTVATAGEVDVAPRLINAIAERARLSLDVRSLDGGRMEVIVDSVTQFAVEAASRRGLSAAYAERGRAMGTGMNPEIVQLLEDCAEAADVPHLRMASGAVHDTLMVARRVPSAMLFVPCRDGVSHSPDEHANCGDAAIAVDVLVPAVCAAARSGARKGRS
jgi:allantoate deiminase